MKHCPECGSNEVLVRSVTSYCVNSGDFYCHSVKTHDSDAEVMCLNCAFEGLLYELKEGEEKK